MLHGASLSPYPALVPAPPLPAASPGAAVSPGANAAADIVGCEGSAGGRAMEEKGAFAVSVDVAETAAEERLGGDGERDDGERYTLMVTRHRLGGDGERDTGDGGLVWT